MPLEDKVPKRFIAWKSWFLQKEVFLNPHQADVTRMSQAVCAATWVMTAADYWCCVYDLHAVQHIWKPIHFIRVAPPSLLPALLRLQRSFLHKMALFRKHHRHVWGRINANHCSSQHCGDFWCASVSFCELALCVAFTSVQWCLSCAHALSAAIDYALHRFTPQLCQLWKPYNGTFVFLMRGCSSSVEHVDTYL